MKIGTLFQVRWYGLSPAMEILAHDLDRNRARKMARSRMTEPGNTSHQAMFIDREGRIELWDLGTFLEEERIGMRFNENEKG